MCKSKKEKSMLLWKGWCPNIMATNFNFSVSAEHDCWEVGAPGRFGGGWIVCTQAPAFGCKYESTSSEVFLRFSVVSRSHLSASMQWTFLVRSDVSEVQQEQVRVPPGAFLYSDLKYFLRKNSILKIKALHQTGDLPCITTQCFHYHWKISSLCSNRQLNLRGKVVKQNVEAFMQVIPFLESVKRCNCLRLPFSWLHCGGGFWAVNK